MEILDKAKFTSFYRDKIPHNELRVVMIRSDGVRSVPLPVQKVEWATDDRCDISFGTLNMKGRVRAVELLCLDVRAMEDATGWEAPTEPTEQRNFKRFFVLPFGYDTPLYPNSTFTVQVTVVHDWQ